MTGGAARRKGWWWAQDRIWDLPLGLHARVVYLYLRRRANREGVAWPSVATIAQRTEMSERQVRRALDRLYETGLVVREHRGGRGGPSHYLLDRKSVV